jgi:hypothetical protein
MTDEFGDGTAPTFRAALERRWKHITNERIHHFTLTGRHTVRTALQMLHRPSHTTHSADNGLLPV